MTIHQNPRNRVFRQWATVLVSLFSLLTFALAQQPESNVPRSLNLHEAVELALRHNHVVRIAALHVEEEQHAKEVARSAYLPTIRNDSSFAHLTDTEFIGIPAGGLGVIGNSVIPPRQLIISQKEHHHEWHGADPTAQRTVQNQSRKRRSACGAEGEP